jgi:hypothetical protein
LDEGEKEKEKQGSREDELDEGLPTFAGSVSQGLRLGCVILGRGGTGARHALLGVLAHRVGGVVETLFGFGPEHFDPADDEDGDQSDDQDVFGHALAFAVQRLHGAAPQIELLKESVLEKRHQKAQTLAYPRTEKRGRACQGDENAYQRQEVFHRGLALIVRFNGTQDVPLILCAEL